VGLLGLRQHGWAYWGGFFGATFWGVFVTWTGLVFLGELFDDTCRYAVMSCPRPVFAGDVVHIQRRIRDGRFFLVPRAEILELVTYAYGLAADKFGLVLHAVCVMSNHLHVVATDVEGRHPEFTAWAHRVMALALKGMHGVEGAVWQEGGASVQRLVGSVAVAEALAYVRVNPVAAGCVPHDRRYPGVFGADEEAPLAEIVREVTRPECFGEESTLPEVSTFVCRPPSSLVDELGEERGAAMIAEAVGRHRVEARARRVAEGRGFLGMKRVLAADPWTRPDRPPSGAGSPSFKGAIAEAIQLARRTLIVFRRAYAEAMAAFRAGRRDVRFPPGTYLMRRRLGCACAGGVV
jgi:putative transposase